MDLMTDTQLGPILREALDQEILSGDQPWAVFYDLDALHERFDRLAQAFPADALHAAAIKANPLVAVLAQLVARGAGLEAASAPELAVAASAGAKARATVYDSPAKTVAELDAALRRGVILNANSLRELERIASLDPDDDARIGIRINPVVGAGTIEDTSVSTATSQFGVSLLREQRALLQAFQRYPWLRGLHVHTGSQGCDTDLLVTGIRRCVDFAQKLDAKFQTQRVDTIDIGGGLPIAYRPHIEAPTIEDYAADLRREIPELFQRRWQLITEFGRWLHGPCAFAASRIEYLKESPAGPIATIHFGADLLIRRVYRPDDWFHRLSIYDATGRPRIDDDVDLTVAGPLCFSGDVIARGQRHPRPDPGDWLVAHDVGAYTLSMWSRYCSRPFPRVYGFRRRDESLHFQTLHPGESASTVVEFWKGP